VREQQSQFDADVVLIEDKASGTQLIQELIADGFHSVKRYKPECDKIHAPATRRPRRSRTALVHLPESASWLAEYLHEMTVFHEGQSNDDQVDSTAQFLDWFKTPMTHWGIFEHWRRMAEELKPPEQCYRPPPGASRHRIRSDLLRPAPQRRTRWHRRDVGR